MSYSAKPANEKRLYVKSFCNIFFAEEKLVSPYFLFRKYASFCFFPSVSLPYRYGQKRKEAGPQPEKSGGCPAFAHKNPLLLILRSIKPHFSMICLYEIVAHLKRLLFRSLAQKDQRNLHFFRQRSVMPLEFGGIRRYKRLFMGIGADRNVVAQQSRLISSVAEIPFCD